MDRLDGTVVWFDPKLGYGFIQGAEPPDMFVHWSDVSSEGFKTLKKGQKVTYTLGTNHSGRPKAVEVEVVDEPEG